MEWSVAGLEAGRLCPESCKAEPCQVMASAPQRAHPLIGGPSRATGDPVALGPSQVALVSSMFPAA